MYSQKLSQKGLRVYQIILVFLVLSQLNPGKTLRHICNLSMCISTSISNIGLFPCLSLSVSVCLCPSLCVSVSVCLSLPLSVSLSAYLYVKHRSGIQNVDLERGQFSRGKTIPTKTSGIFLFAEIRRVPTCKIY